MKNKSKLSSEEGQIKIFKKNNRSVSIKALARRLSMINGIKFNLSAHTSGFDQSENKILLTKKDAKKGDIYLNSVLAHEYGHFLNSKNRSVLLNFIFYIAYSIFKKGVYVLFALFVLEISFGMKFNLLFINLIIILFISIVLLEEISASVKGYFFLKDVYNINGHRLPILLVYIHSFITYLFQAVALIFLLYFVQIGQHIKLSN